MCDPVTLTIAATAASAMGSLSSGYSAFMQGEAANKVAKRNAQMDERAARDAMDRGDEAVEAHYREVAQIKGAQVAGAAAAGLDVGFGSSLNQQVDTATLANIDAGIIMDNASREAEGLRIQAWNSKVQGESAKAQGRAAALNSVFQAAGTILGGASQAGGMQAKYGNTAGTGAGKMPAWVGAPVGR
jgi:hypothetical protein